jgi:phytol kinase
MRALTQFFFDNLPTLGEVAVLGPPSLLWALFWLAVAGYLKRRVQWPTGYTRKVFHFGIFFTAALLQALSGTRAVCLFGAMSTFVIAFALVRGSGDFLYEAIAREKDAPHRTHYIVVPYLATLIGGVLSTIWFGPAALAGFMVTGVGDAVGEPVGTRFGHHTYRVPGLRGVTCTRSWEGSVAVFAVSALAVFLSLVLLADGGLSVRTAIIALGIGCASAACEAVSRHGWDNATMQIVPSWLVWLAVS